MSGENNWWGSAAGANDVNFIGDFASGDLNTTNYLTSDPFN